MAKTAIREDQHGLFALHARGVYRPVAADGIAVSDEDRLPEAKPFRKGDVIRMYTRLEHQWCLARGSGNLGGEVWYFHGPRSAMSGDEAPWNPRCQGGAG